MKSIVDSILHHTPGPKKTTQSASVRMLRRHLTGASKSVFEATFYGPKRLVRSLSSPSELSSATASISRRFSAKFSAK
jgi:hypothetical protein